MRFVVPVPFWLYAVCLGTVILIVFSVGLVVVTVVAVIAYAIALFKKPVETLAGTVLFFLIALAFKFPPFGLILFAAFVYSVISGQSATPTASTLDQTSDEPISEGQAAESARRARAAEEALLAVAAQKDARRRELADQGFEGYEQFKK
jgi:chromate transport protein ChrA